MPDHDDVSRTPTPMPELLAAAAGVSLQLATTGTVGAVVGAMLPPALLGAWRLDQATFAPRLARTARTVEVACEELGVDVPELERMAVRDAATTSLVGRVLAASANAATAQEKIDALGRVLAAGLGDDDRLDEALILAAALDDLEAPHVRVLTVIAGQVHWSKGTAAQVRMVREGSSWSADELKRRLRHYRLTIEAVLATLERHGLIRADVGDVAEALHRQREQKANGRSGRAWDAPSPEYDVTDLGLAALRLLVEAQQSQSQSSLS